MNTKFFVCFLDDAGKMLSSSGQSFPAVQMNDSSGLPGFKPGFTYSAENIIHSPVTFSVPAGAVRVFCGISYAVFGDVVKSPSAWLNNFLPYLSLSPDFNVSFYLAIQDADSSSDVEEITRQTSPYYDSSSGFSLKQKKMSAYPFRAYEGIYNAYYRDIRNNPFILNGQEEYNVFIPNDEGGADLLTYPLHYANWERDMFTTAVPSPQQGRAPLVGLTTYTDIVQNDDGTRTTSLKVALVDEDGRRYKVSASGDADAMKAVSYEELPNDYELSPMSPRKNS